MIAKGKVLNVKFEFTKEKILDLGLMTKKAFIKFLAVDNFLRY